jgi:ribosomal protein L11 methyltransferase
MYQCQLRAADPQLTEELLWTLEGMVAIDYAVQQPGVLRVYSTTPLAENLAGLGQVQWLTPTQPVYEQDWAESWKQHWHVTPITPQLTICPSWLAHTPSNPSTEKVLTLDPGSAFGNGTHDTTVLMLEQLDALSQQRQGLAQTSVLDVGTGSGILAVAAGLMGATQIMGQDIDPLTVPVAEANALLNHQPHITWTATPLPQLCLTRYDLVLANILAPVIVELMPDLACRMAQPDGLLLTSGIIHTAAPQVVAAAQACGLVQTHMATRGQWVALTFAAA